MSRLTQASRRGLFAGLLGKRHLQHSTNSTPELNRKAASDLRQAMSHSLHSASREKTLHFLEKLDLKLANTHPRVTEENDDG